MNTLLALETSTRACSVALWHAGAVHVLEEMTPQAHARKLLPMVENVLREAAVRPEQVEGLIFGKGPGAFTGLRITTAVVQGLALGWNCPVVGLSGLEAMAWWHSCQQHEPVVAALDARMGECYAAIYTRGRLQMPASLMKPDALQGVIEQAGVVYGVGDAANVFPELGQTLNNWMPDLPSARHLAMMAMEMPVSFEPLESQIPVPLYLRNQVADKPKGER